jgi:hypothetical protein
MMVSDDAACADEFLFSRRNSESDCAGSRAETRVGAASKSRYNPENRYIFTRLLEVRLFERRLRVLQGSPTVG